MRDYMLVSPSLDGLLAHESIYYGGVKRPVELLRVYDSPARISLEEVGSNNDKEELQRYFVDLYSVFMKRFSGFVVDTDVGDDELITLQAMLQEMIKIKKILLS